MQNYTLSFVQCHPCSFLETVSLLMRSVDLSFETVLTCNVPLCQESASAKDDDDDLDVDVSFLG